MSAVSINEEYKVLVTHLPVNGQSWRWRATVLGFPDISEEGNSREQVIQQVESRVSDILRHSEIVTLNVSSSSKAAGDDALITQGWDDHGLFKGDPEALQLFDEIEEERNRNPVI